MSGHGSLDYGRPERLAFDEALDEWVELDAPAPLVRPVVTGRWTEVRIPPPRPKPPVLRVLEGGAG